MGKKKKTQRQKNIDKNFNLIIESNKNGRKSLLCGMKKEFVVKKIKLFKLKFRKVE